MHTRVLVDLSLIIYLCPRNEGAGKWRKQCKNYTDKPYEFDEAKQEEELKKEAEVQAEAWMRNFVNLYKV